MRLPFLLLFASLSLLRAEPTPAAPPIPSLDDVRSKAEAGDPVAQQRMGEAYYLGQGAPKDYTQAFAWANKAAQQGNAQAQVNLAWLYHAGQGVEKNDVTARDWYLKAAQQGHTGAMEMLGNMTFRGEGVPKDEAQAIAWEQKAADLGDRQALEKVGWAYLYGRGVPQDLEKGFTYVLNAAASVPGAALQVARCYQDGIFVQKDPLMAYRWALCAQRIGPCDEATTLLNALKPTLSADQIATAEKLVEDFNRIRYQKFQLPEFSIQLSPSPQAIPFKFWCNAILLPTHVGTRQQIAYFLLDTGASCSLIDSTFAAANGIKTGDYFTSYGINGKLTLTNISQPFNLTVGDTRFEQVRMVLSHDINLSTDLAFPIAGIIGSDLLATFATRVEFSDNTLTFLDPAHLPPDPAGTTVIPLDLLNPKPHLTAQILNHGTTSSGLFLLDTGDIGEITLAQTFQTANPSLQFDKVAESGAAGLGGILHTIESICTAFQIGSLQVARPKVELLPTVPIRDQGPAVAGTVGMEIWRRFDLILDYPNSKLHLTPNASLSDPFPPPTSGMKISGKGPDYNILFVEVIIPGSRAAAAGFQVGDIIQAIQEIHGPLTLDAIYQLFGTSGTYHFTVQRGDKDLPLTLQASG